MSQASESSPTTGSGSPASGAGEEGLVWVVTVGDELLAGDITDTNLAHLAQCCRAGGATVVRAVSVRDRVEEIARAVLEAVAAGAGACLVSGGLGPTTDDRTTAALAVAAGVAVRRDAEALQRLQAKFKAFGRAMPPANEKQAEFPAGSQILPNPIGTAEGFMVQVGECQIFSMPGVPRELKMMLANEVLPRLAKRWTLRPAPRRVYRILGHGESAVAERIEGILGRARARSAGLANLFVHYRASMPEVSVIVEAVRGASNAAGQATASELASLDAELVPALRPGIYGIGEASLAARIAAAARRGSTTLAVAESCTGGRLGAMITEVPGASAFFLGGVVAYDNRIKRSLLRVPAGMLAEHGAVSEPVARAMAVGGRAATGADLCVATTGIAGPGGGTPEKPVGTVFVAVSDESETTHVQLKLRGDRGTVQQAASRWALKLVWDRLVMRGHASVQPMD